MKHLAALLALASLVGCSSPTYVTVLQVGADGGAELGELGEGDVEELAADDAGVEAGREAGATSAPPASPAPPAPEPVPPPAEADAGVVVVPPPYVPPAAPPLQSAGHAARYAWCARVRFCPGVVMPSVAGCAGALEAQKACSFPQYDLCQKRLDIYTKPALTCADLFAMPDACKPCVNATLTP